MGKSRQKKANVNRADPVAIKAVKAPTDPELIQLREQHVLPIIKDLRSSDLKARGAAASAIANIVQQEKCRKLLLREQVVPIVLTETLTDSSLDSRAAGWEILRVIATEEDKDFCVHLFRLEILTAIEYAVRTVSDFRPSSSMCCLLTDFFRLSELSRTHLFPSHQSLSNSSYGILPQRSSPSSVALQRLGMR